jgi:exopolyphosphatase
MSTSTTTIEQSLCLSNFLSDCVQWLTTQQTLSSDRVPVPVPVPVAEELAQDSVPSVRVVMGNEAADADSVICAIVYAWHLNCQEIKSTHENSDTQTMPNASAAGRRPIILPLINIPRSELALRTEIPTLLARLGVTSPEQQLIFLDDVPLEEWAHTGKMSVTLVDHNRLASSQQFLSHCIEAIVDHHMDEKLHVNEDRPYPRDIRTIGSCSTLIAEYVLKCGSVPRAIADSLIRVILLDTGNMNPAMKKGTDTDRKMLEALCQYSSINTSAFDKEYQEFMRLRVDVSQLSFAQMLLRDTKLAVVDSVRFAVSSITADFATCLLHTVPISERKTLSLDDASTKIALLQKAAADLKAFTVERKLSFVAVMTAFTASSGEFCRELGLCSFGATSPLYTTMQSLVLASDTAGLDTDPNFSLVTDSISLTVFRQQNVSSSRKQIMPLLANSVSASSKL